MTQNRLIRVGKGTGPAIRAPVLSAVSTICAVDSFCCDSSWDATCVGEVTSVCGNNCD